ncbi:hypothetical protein [Halobacillus trueperi]|uniref:hypothetical protein n=1 Tax=Halobacillus trueperi TaxID=156205 RepID=UPI00142DD6B5|nr:hypothetical protein [Halobacillus trueperi]
MTENAQFVVRAYCGGKIRELGTCERKSKKKRWGKSSISFSSFWVNGQTNDDKNP